MTDLFLKIFNISITASYLVVAVLLLRLILKKAPKWSICLLWGIVALRLVMPFSLESELSLIPSVNTVVVSDTADVPFEINTGVSTVDTEINNIITENKESINEVNQSINDTFVVVEDNLNSSSENTTDTNQQNSKPAESTKISIFTVLGYAWFIGVWGMLIYSAISFLVIRKKVKVCLHYRDNIYYCDNIDTSFILGTFKPKIYIQSGMSQENTDYVIKHESAHLNRCDHLLKPFAFLLLSAHWFNPLIWVAYILLCRDIESACDERVIKGAEDIDIKGYSMALLNCGTKRRMFVACPVAFGEVSVKSRIKAVLKYKRPPRWVCVVAIVLSTAVAFCFLTDPIQKVSALAENIEFETVTEYIDRTKNTSSENKPSSNSIFNNILSIFDKNKNENQNSSQTTANESQAEINSDINREDDPLIDSPNIWYPVKDDSSTDSSSENESSTDNNSSQDGTTSGKEDSDQTNSSEPDVDSKPKTALFTVTDKVDNDEGNTVVCYKSSEDIYLCDWFLEEDCIHMALKVYGEEYSYVYTVFDTNTGEIIFEKPLPDSVGEMHCRGDELWVSYPTLHSIYIYDKQSLECKDVIWLDDTVHSFDFYKDYIIYAQSDGTCYVNRYELCGITTRITNENYDSFYRADVLVNEEHGLVYLCEFGNSGCKVYCYDIETLSLQTKFALKGYGFGNTRRTSFLRDGYLYWGNFKLDPIKFSNVNFECIVPPTTGYGYPSDGIIQVTDEYIVLSSGIYEKSSSKLVREWNYYGNGIYKQIITTSGNLMSIDSDAIYLELGAFK